MSDWPNILHRNENNKYSLSLKCACTGGEKKGPLKKQREKMY